MIHLLTAFIGRLLQTDTHTVSTGKKGPAGDDGLLGMKDGGRNLITSAAGAGSP